MGNQAREYSDHHQRRFGHLGAPWCSTRMAHAVWASRPPLVVRMRFDEGDRVLNGHDPLDRPFRDLAAELLFERHHQFDRFEAIRPPDRR